MKIYIVDNHEIDKSISVVVTEGGSSRPSAVGHTSFCGHVGEGAISVIAIEDVAAQAGHIKVRPAVVVVVSYSSAHSKAWRGKARFCRHIGKSAVVVVMVKNAEALRAFHRHFNRWGIREINVGPAVPIIVQQNHSTAHGFHDVFLCRVGGMFEGDAGLGSNVFELWNRAPATLR